MKYCQCTRSDIERLKSINWLGSLRQDSVRVNVGWTIIYHIVIDSEDMDIAWSHFLGVTRVVPQHMNLSPLQYIDVILDA